MFGEPYYYCQNGSLGRFRAGIVTLKINELIG